MGVYQADYLIVELATDEGSEIIDKWIKRRRGEFKSLFSKFVHLRNSGVSYIMWYDGSKEFWNCSEHANKLREEFVKISRKAEASSILHIQPGGELNDFKARIVDLTRVRCERMKIAEFISTYEYYDLESSGKKSYTIRNKTGRTMAKLDGATHVRIRRGYTKKCFTEPITHILEWYNFLIVAFPRCHNKGKRGD